MQHAVLMWIISVKIISSGSYMEIGRPDMAKVCAGVERAMILALHMLLLRCSWHCFVHLHVWASVTLGENKLSYLQPMLGQVC